MPCLFRLLYATGMRISEALSIRNEDVDFSNNFIILRKTKNNKERIIPMNERLKEVLMQYIKYRDLVPVEGISNPDRYLFDQDSESLFLQRLLTRSLKEYWKNVESIIVVKTKVHESMTYVRLLPSIPFTECHQKM